MREIQNFYRKPNKEQETKPCYHTLNYDSMLGSFYLYSSSLRFHYLSVSVIFIIIFFLPFSEFSMNLLTSLASFLCKQFSNKFECYVIGIIMPTQRRITILSNLFFGLVPRIVQIEYRAMFGRVLEQKYKVQ